jgi:thiol-disulfide isomerase/thioredoxin
LHHPFIGKAAPEITAEPIGGEGPKTLAEALGKVVVVDFWASCCGPCKASFPIYQTILDKFPGDVAVIAVDTDEPGSKTKADPTRTAPTSARGSTVARCEAMSLPSCPAEGRMMPPNQPLLLAGRAAGPALRTAAGSAPRGRAACRWAGARWDGSASDGTKVSAPARRLACGSEGQPAAATQNLAAPPLGEAFPE